MENNIKEQEDKKPKMKFTYIGETICLSQSDGELYVSFEEAGKEHTLVFDIINLYRDLPSWISMVKAGHKEHQDYIDKRIKEEANGMV